MKKNTPYVTPYVMGIDGGVGSLAVALLTLDEKDRACSMLDGTVRIFPAAASAAERRVQKSAMRQHRRKSQRLAEARTLLAEIFGLEQDFHKRQEKKNAIGKMVYDNTDEIVLWRGKAASEKINPLPLARVLYLLMHSRGIRLVRDSESGKMLQANRRMREDMDEGETVGQFLAKQHLKGESIKARPDAALQRGFIATRKDIRYEMETILAIQEKHYPALKEKEEEILSLFAYEHPTKTPAKGKCCYFEHGDEDRIRKFHPLAQDKRLYEEICNITVYDKSGKKRKETEGKLTREEREKLFDFCREKKENKATQLEKKLKLTDDYDLQLPAVSRRQQKVVKGTEKEVSIKGNLFVCALKGTKFDAVWQDGSDEEKDGLAEILLEEDEMDKAVDKLTPFFPDLEREEVEDAWDAGDALKAFPRTLTLVGRSATEKLLQAFRDGATRLRGENSAEAKAGLTHKEEWGGVLYDAPPDRLPYYGDAKALAEDCLGATQHPADPLEVRFGRMPNRVVHRFLNELRKVVNLFVKQYGLPTRIHIELGRELSKGEKEREDIQKQNADRRKKNEAYDALILKYGKTPSRKYRRKLFLLETQKACPYTGRSFSEEDMFNGKTDIDHILPKSATHDDNLSNLVLCHADVNKYKKNRSPFQAFGGGFPDFRRTYDQMLTDVKGNRDAYPPAKKWRFREDAMERYEDEERWQRRFLSDNAYAAKAARRYLLPLMGKNERIVCLSGGLTSELGYQWGLRNIHKEGEKKEGEKEGRKEEGREKEKKSRDDYRHNLVDAITIACTTRSHIQRLQTHFGKRERYKLGEEEKPPQFQAPWQDFRGDVKDFVADPRRISLRTARIKTDRKTQKTPPAGALHKETLYGLVAQLDSGESIYRLKKSLSDLPADQKKIEQALTFSLADRKAILEAFDRQQQDGKKRLYWGGDKITRKELESQLDAAVKKLEYLKGKIFTAWEQAPDKDEDGKPLGEKQRLLRAVMHLDEEREERKEGRKVVRVVRLRRYTEFGRRSLVVIGEGKDERGKAQRPQRLVWGRNNAWLDVWHDAELEWNWEVQSLLDASLGKLMPWQDEDGSAKEGYRHLLRLQKQDTVEMESRYEVKNKTYGFRSLEGQKPHRVLARVQALSKDICIFVCWRPLVRDDKDNIRRVQSLEALKQAKIELVIATLSARLSRGQKYRGTEAFCFQKT